MLIYSFRNLTLIDLENIEYTHSRFTVKDQCLIGDEEH